MYNSDYYMWLLHRIGNYENYSELLGLLYSIDFTYVFMLDGNRAAAGLNLRGLYAMEMGISTEDVQIGPCTVLEMFVALADSFSEYSGQALDNCFWEMIDNLGLSQYDDYHCNDSYILECVQNWMHHVYERDGRGSVFPLRSYDGDVRNMEIWNQMNAYILENYPLKGG